MAGVFVVTTFFAGSSIACAAEQGGSVRQFSLCHYVRLAGAAGTQLISATRYYFLFPRTGILFTRVRGTRILGSSAQARPYASGLLM